ncbi:uncharacterized protein TNCV_4259401 [Trichonephila clavipes]|nr:uncharacterized protein TNCV_4259401 [Trichonephila clavipes]
MIRFLYKGTLPRNPRSIRRGRIDEADISTLVAVDQRATNCLEGAVRSLTAMLIRCRTSRADVTFRHPLPVLRIVRYLSVHCFQTRIGLWNCSASHELLFRNRKINPPFREGR